MIDIQNLTVIYKGRYEPAVDNLNLKINKGEFYGILGPNGAGKTTLISVISSLIKPSQGEILIDNMNLTNSLTAIKKIIGVVPQDIALYDKLTPYENLKYFGSIYEINKTDLNKKIDSLLDKLGLLHYKHTKLIKLSGGMKRRINLIAAMLHDPAILILDEPVVGLDVQSRNLIRIFLKEINDQNRTIIYTTHILEDVEKMCNRVSVMDYGKIIEQGSPKELVNKYDDCNNLEEVFLKLTGQSTRD